MAARVGEGDVGAAAAAEFGIDLDDGAHVHHQHKGRPPIGHRQGAGIGLALAARAQQAVVKALGMCARPELFGLQHKVAPAVAVNAPGAGRAVAVRKGDGALKHIVLRRGGVRLGHAQRVAKVQHKALRRGQLAGANALPAPDEGLDQRVVVRIRWLWVHPSRLFARCKVWKAQTRPSCPSNLAAPLTWRFWAAR